MTFKYFEKKGIFQPVEVEALQNAYNECCLLLQRCPTSHPEKDRLAKAVLSLFENGQTDPVQIAERLAVLETLKSAEETTDQNSKIA